MENIDPLGIHTGESIVVAPSQTLTNAGEFLEFMYDICMKHCICRVQYTSISCYQDSEASWSYWGVQYSVCP